MRLFSLLTGLVGPALQGALLVILVRRKLYRRFPFFFACVAYSIPITLVRLWVMDQPRMFFILYWTTEMIYGVLALLAIREVFEDVLEMYYSQHGWMRWLEPSIGIGIIGSSIWRAIYHPVGYGGPLGGLAAGAYSFMDGVLCVQALVFVLCLRLGYRRHYPMRWGRYSAGVLVGFGMVAVATLLISMARFRLGVGLELLYRYGPPAAYAAAAVIWLGAFYREEPPMSRKATDPEVYRRAREFASAAAKEAEEDLELRLAPIL